MSSSYESLWGPDVPRGTPADTLANPKPPKRPVVDSASTAVPVDTSPEAELKRQLTRALGPPTPRGVGPALAQAGQNLTERTMAGLTATSRGLSRAGGEAMRGRNPIAQKLYSGETEYPFLEGAKDPTQRWGRELQETMQHYGMPEEALDVALPGANPMTGMPSGRMDPHNTLRTATEVGGLGLDATVDPAAWMGVGAVTRAGAAFRSASTDLKAAQMAMRGAAGVDAAAAAQAARQVADAQQRLAAARALVEAEGTSRSGGRAAVSYFGHTTPALAQGQAMGGTAQVLEKLGQTRVARGVSGMFRPPQMNVDPAIRARGFVAEAAGDIGGREAQRGLQDLVSEYPDVLRALGGDRDALDDALSLAIERSQAHQFSRPTDFLGKVERERYWQTLDEGERASLEAVGKKRALAGRNRYLSPLERHELKGHEKAVQRFDEHKSWLEKDSSGGPKFTDQMTDAEKQEYARAVETERERVANLSMQRSQQGWHVEKKAEEAAKRFGNFVSADNARDLVDEFGATMERRSLFSAAVHEEASAITKQWWKNELAKPPGTGDVLVTGGGPGSGKSSGLPEGILDRVDAVYDAASGLGTGRRIDEALESGRRVIFYFTVRDPMESWAKGVLPRAAGQGRTVPADLAAGAHTQGIENIRQIMDAHAEDVAAGRLQFHLNDNRAGFDNAKTYSGDEALKMLHELPVENKGELHEAYLREADRQAAARLIPHRVWAGVNVKAEAGEAAGAAANAGAGEVLPRAAGADAANAAPQVGAGGPPGGPAQIAAPTRKLEDFSRDISARESAEVAKELESLARNRGVADESIKRLTEKAQSRADIQALRSSVLSARRMYYRGASPEVAKRFGKYASKTVDRINMRNATMFSNTRREGVKLSELTDPQAYLFHAATPELQKAILENERRNGTITKGVGWREFTEKHAPQLTRKLRMTAVEANELFAQGRMAITGFKPVKKAFHTNPFVAQVFREQKGAQAIGYARHLKEVMGEYGLPRAQAPKDWVSVPNEVKGVGENMMVPREIGAHLKRHYEALREPGKILGAYDRLNQIWKNWTLGVFPVYHTRNELGDLWNGVVLGGGGLDYAGHAIHEILGDTRLAPKPGRGKALVFKDGRRFEFGEMRDEAEKFGVLKSSQLNQEVEQRLLGPLADPDGGGLPGAPAVKRIGRAVREAGLGETGATRLASKTGAGLHAAQRQLTDNRAIDAAMTVGNAREQALRLALYIDKRAKGWAPESAALWVRKHLIDYGQASNFENEVVRRALPFYMWTRHNSLLQLEYLFAKPGAFGAVQKARTAAGGDEGSGTGDVPMPQFLAEGVPMRSGTSVEGNPEFARLEGTWPGADALTATSPLTDPKGATRKALSMLAPLPREMAEQATGVDFWRSRPGKPVPIEDFPGEKGTFLGMSMNKRLIHALQNVRPLTELNRLNPGDIFGTSDEPAFGGAGQVREYPDIDPEQRWMNLLIGRGYAIDPQKNESDWVKARERALRQLEYEIRSAEASGQTAKAEAARLRYEFIQAHPESISPDMAK